MIRVIALLVLATVPGWAQQKADIEKFIDAWHLAATNANASDFFGAMDDDCIYIGTDASE